MSYSLAVPFAPRSRLSSPLPLLKEPPTAKKPPSKPAKGDDPNEKLIANNRKARFNYEVVDTLECGHDARRQRGEIARRPRVDRGSLRPHGKGRGLLVGADIQEYKNANVWNHEPKRRRKLLLHRREITKFAGWAYEKTSRWCR